MKPEYNPNIEAEIARIKPHGDFVLVRRAPELEKASSGLITEAPKRRENDVPGLRLGIVVAIGPGDTRHWLECPKCWHQAARLLRETRSHSTERRSFTITATCPKCGAQMGLTGKTDYAPMNVSVGDTVVFDRVPANEVQIGGVAYSMCHEEQHIRAVVERAA